MQKVYFVCPKTGKELGKTFDIPNRQTTMSGMFDVLCHHCGEIHRFYGRDVQRSEAVSQKKPKAKRVLL